MAIGDQYFDKVVFASNFDGAFADEANTWFSKVTGLAGNSTISETQSKFGGKSLYLAGAGGYAYLLNSPDFNFGAGDFTVEGWFYPTNWSVSPVLFGKRPANTSYAPFVLYLLSSGKLSADVSVTGSDWALTPTSANVVFTINTWHHVAFVRDGVNLYAYVNGVLAFTSAISTNALFANVSQFNIGGDTNTNHFTGYVDSFRVTKGYCRYPAGTTFSVPTAAFPMYAAQLQGTVKDANGNFARRLVKGHRRADGLITDAVLSNQSDGTFTLNTRDTSKHYVVVHDSDAWITYLPFNGDNNSTLFYEWGGKSVTPYGNAKISTTQSKFGGAAAYLDGTGDYLQLDASSDFAFGTADFTVEGWIRLDSLGVERAILDNRAATTDTGLYIGVNASNQLFAFGNNATIVTGTTTALTATTWEHIAVVKSSGTLSLYLNGSLVGSAASSYTMACPGALVIGRKLGSTSNDFVGYIDDLRISKGVARYIANFTPPTVPHFTVQAGDPYWNNVVLGCHFNNGETPTFKDVATGKILTANGDVEIVSTQSKFGGYSAYFDGAGDCLNAPHSSDLDLAGADFTIDFWFRANAVNATQVMVLKRPSSSVQGYVIEIESTGKLGGYFGDSNTTSWNCTLQSMTTLVANTWYHAAFTRVGSTFSMYLNGSLEATYAEAFTVSSASGALYIGSSESVGNPYAGYIDDLRITVGVSRFNGAYATPTAAFYEQLQTYGQQNAMIYDHLTPV